METAILPVKTLGPHYRMVKQLKIQKLPKRKVSRELIYFGGFSLLSRDAGAYREVNGGNSGATTGVMKDGSGNL